jgi:hypothetical protein
MIRGGFFIFLSFLLLFLRPVFGQEKGRGFNAPRSVEEGTRYQIIYRLMKRSDTDIRQMYVDDDLIAGTSVHFNSLFRLYEPFITFGQPPILEDSEGVVLGKWSTNPFLNNVARTEIVIPAGTEGRVAYTNFGYQQFNQCDFDTGFVDLPFIAEAEGVIQQIIIEVTCSLYNENQPRVLKYKLTEDSAEFVNAGKQVKIVTSYVGLPNGEHQTSLPAVPSGPSPWISPTYAVDEGEFVSVVLETDDPNWTCRFDFFPDQPSHPANQDEAEFNVYENHTVPIKCEEVNPDTAKLTVQMNSQLFNGHGVSVEILTSEIHEYYWSEIGQNHIENINLINSNFTVTIDAPPAHLCTINGENTSLLTGNLLSGDQTVEIDCEPISCGEWDALDITPKLRCVQEDDPDNTCNKWPGMCALKYIEQNNCGERRMKMLGCVSCGSPRQCSRFWPSPILSEMYNFTPL